MGNTGEIKREIRVLDSVISSQCLIGRIPYTWVSKSFHGGGVRGQNNIRLAASHKLLLSWLAIPTLVNYSREPSLMEEIGHPESLASLWRDAEWRLENSGRRIRMWL